MILAIDPGKDSGWSVWSSTGDTRLLGCGLGLPPPLNASVICIEIPQVYKDSQVDPATLIVLAMDVGRRLEGAFLLGSAQEAFGFRPATWKKQIAKEPHHEFVRRSLSIADLSIAEHMQCPKGKQHNVWDAIALGQWVCHRRGLLRTLSDYVFRPLR